MEIPKDFPHVGTTLLDMMPPNHDERMAPHVGVLLTTSLMTYELGTMVRQVVYGLSALENVGDAKLAKAYFDFARTEMEDLVTQCEVLCQRMGWLWSDILRIGPERMAERMLSIRDKKI